MRFLFAVMIIAALLCGCAGHRQSPTDTAPASQKKPIQAPWAFTTPDGARISPVSRIKPFYPAREQYRGIQGCVNVFFHLDSQGRPTRLQAWASYPNGAFDTAAIHTLTQWRFRVTDASGQPTTTSFRMGQEILFLMGRQNPSVLGWICRQPPPRTLVVAPTSETAGIQVSSKKPKQWVSVVQMPNPRHKRLGNGWVNVSFCIDAKGHVVDASVKNSSPTGLYDRAALTALRSWHYEARHATSTVSPLFANRGEYFTPRIIKGQPVKTCGLSYHITVIGSDALASGPAAINQRLTAIPIRDLPLPSGPVPPDGRVSLQFCVDKDGSVSDIRIDKSRPRGIYNKTAKQMLHLWSYWPQTVNGKPIHSCGIHETVIFKLGRSRLVWVYPATS